MKKSKVLDTITAVLLSIDFIAVVILSVFIIGSINGAFIKDDKAVNQDLGNILTGTVEINIPKEFLELDGEKFDYVLTEEQKENGFTNIKKNEDGSATYTIKKKNYEKYIKELREAAKQGIDELTKDGSFASIKSITYNNNLSKITITADKNSFENGLDSLSVFSCGLASIMYQMFDIDAPGKCTVEVKDSATGEIFQTTVYPDALDSE